MSLMKYEVEKITGTIARMNRNDLTREILQFDGRFKLDFSENYLSQLPLEKLRHILLAAKLQQMQAN